MLKWARGAVVAVLIASSWNTAGAGEGTRKDHARPAAEQKSFDRFVERLAAEWMRADPISATV